ncbi:hypothetical protein A3Q56_04334 [Intoshia linei]|uniref:Actin-related protein 2/3 complex subunit 4 n=1 Tax=Intoshia linei TaxID=1819745 RepID=A0A177B2M6_9BILA|nr:hypothetical protein A3Q56_04334 [Intoshia linei]
MHLRTDNAFMKFYEKSKLERTKDMDLKTYATQAVNKQFVKYLNELTKGDVGICTLFNSVYGKMQTSNLKEMMKMIQSDVDMSIAYFFKKIGDDSNSTKFGLQSIYIVQIKQDKMSSEVKIQNIALKSYLTAIHRTLKVCFCIRNFDSQNVDGHNKPEVEIKCNNELLLTTFVISRNEKEKILIESSVNSVRISILIKQSDDLEKVLAHKLTRYFMRRAEELKILRRSPLPGYSISFLVTNRHIETMKSDEIITFFTTFMDQVDKTISDMKINVHSRGRAAAVEMLKLF